MQSGRRRHDRYPLVKHGLLRGHESMNQIVAVLDISAGGMALEVSHWDGEERLTLGLLWEGERISLPIDVCGTEDTARGTLIHGQFGTLSAKQKSVIRAIISECAESFQNWQQYIAFRLNDPITG